MISAIFFYLKRNPAIIVAFCSVVVSLIRLSLKAAEMLDKCSAVFSVGCGP